MENINKGIAVILLGLLCDGTSGPRRHPCLPSPHYLSAADIWPACLSSGTQDLLWLNTLCLPILSRMIFKEFTQLGLMHLKVPLIPFYFKEPGSCILYSICLGPPKFRLKLESRYRVVSKQVHWSAGTEVSVFTEGHRNQGNPCAFCSPTM